MCRLTTHPLTDLPAVVAMAVDTPAEALPDLVPPGQPGAPAAADMVPVFGVPREPTQPQSQITWLGWCPRSSRSAPLFGCRQALNVASFLLGEAWRIEAVAALHNVHADLTHHSFSSPSDVHWLESELQRHLPALTGRKAHVLREALQVVADTRSIDALSPLQRCVVQGVLGDLSWEAKRDHFRGDSEVYTLDKLRATQQLPPA